jgi:hypothetical protein
MRKLAYLPLVLLLSFLFVSCGDDNPASPDLKTGIDGTWLVTRTLVTPSKDFPAGYKDQQTWTIKTNGETATLTTTAGTIDGKWTSSANFTYSHWYFEYEGPDPRTGMQIKIVIEIINAGPFKGTNESYFWDPYSSRFLLNDSFSCTGVKQ